MCVRHWPVERKEGTLYVNTGLFKVNIGCNVCPTPDCDYEEPYDGLRDKVFYHTKKRCYAHSLFNGWTTTRVKSASTLTAYYTQIASSYCNNGYVDDHGKALLPGIVHFTKAYEAFISKQRWTRELSCRYCEQAGRLPALVGMDCTQICMKYEKMKHIITPRESYKLFPEDTKKVKMRYTVNKTPMVYIGEYKLRKRTANYLIGTNVRTYAKDKGVAQLQKYKFTKTYTKALMADLVEAGGKTFVDLLKWYEANVAKMKGLVVKEILGDILRALANYVPLFKLSPCPINDTICDFKESMMRDKKKRETITQYVPFYCLIYEGLARTKEKIRWPKCLTEVIKDLAKRSKAVLDILIKKRSKSKALSPMTTKEKTLFSDANLCGTCTALEPHHLRPHYDFYSESDKYRAKQENKKTRNKITPRIIGETETELVGDCKKHFQDHVKMSSGTLTAMCLEHRQTFLYSNLKRAESVDNYFTALLMYYPGNDAPTDLISDNPCNIQPYMIYREPTKFKDVQHHSDIFHGWTGHKCGPLYCSKYWKTDSSKYHRINTSLIESNNNILKRMYTSAMWMRLDTFNLYFMLILEIRNRIIIRGQEKKFCY